MRAAPTALFACATFIAGIHASQWRRRGLTTASPHAAHGIGTRRNASGCGVPHVLLAYGRGCEALRGVSCSEAAWRRKIRAAFGSPVEPFSWEEQPALAQLVLSTWSVIKPYLQNQNIRPSDFLLVATLGRSLSDFADVHGVCCPAPQPSCFLFDDPAEWASQEWRCLRCGKPTPSLRFRSYASVIHGTLDSFEVKRLCANGDEPGPNTMRGLTIPRPVRVEWITAIGKEVIVDPTDTDEGLTAEMLSETSVVEYRDPAERLDALREAVQAAGIKIVARETGLSPRHLREFVNHKSTPPGSTIAKIEAALRRIGLGNRGS